MAQMASATTVRAVQTKVTLEDVSQVFRSDGTASLHGAACHCCVMASETSCERANRFLDRRFLIDLPGSGLGFFGRGD